MASEGSRGGNMDDQTKSRIDALNEAQSSSDQYLKELQTKILKLRAEIGETDAIKAQYEAAIHNFEGRILVYQQKTEDLQIERLNAMMEKTKEDFKTAKLEFEDLSAEIFERSTEMVYDVRESTIEIEELRMNHMIDAKMSNLANSMTTTFNNLTAQIDDTEAAVQEMEEFKERVSEDMKTFARADEAMEQIIDDHKKIDAEIDELENYLEMRERRAEFYGFRKQ